MNETGQVPIPTNEKQPKCDICGKLQEWCKFGYWITKDWYGYNIHKSSNSMSNFGKSLFIHYPSSSMMNNIVCKDCLSKLVVSYQN